MVPKPGPVQQVVEVIDRATGKIRPAWYVWLTSVLVYLLNSVVKAGSVSYAEQAAAKAVVTVFTPSSTGLYRISWYLRVTRAATVSSDVTVTARWTDGGVAMSDSGALLFDNTTTTFESVSLYVSADQGTEITIETAYNSNGVTDMQYALNCHVEAMP